MPSCDANAEYTSYPPHSSTSDRHDGSAIFRNCTHPPQLNSSARVGRRHDPASWLEFRSANKMPTSEKHKIQHETETARPAPTMPSLAMSTYDTPTCSRPVPHAAAMAGHASRCACAKRRIISNTHSGGRPAKRARTNRPLSAAVSSSRRNTCTSSGSAKAHTAAMGTHASRPITVARWQYRPTSDR